MENLGKILIISGIILVVAGLILFFAGSKLNWLGHLPGDIRIERENVRIYIPLTTMIIISILLSVILFLIRKIM